MLPLNPTAAKPLLKYRRIRRLGQGNFAEVILVEDLQLKQLKAIKKIALNGSEDLNQILNEVRLLQNCSHRNIIKCFSFYKDFGRLNIELEYCDEGDLFKKITDAKAKNEYISEELILNWVSQLCLAICYLHENRILHRDIKPQNIFLTKDGTLKLGDFGIAKKLDVAIDFTKTTLGTPYYLSPEIALGKNYGFPSDMWMMGIVLYELMTLEKPFEGESLHSVMNKIVNQDPPTIQTPHSPFLKTLTIELLEKDPNKRLTIQGLIIKPEIQAEISKFKEKYSPDGKPSKLSFQEYLRKWEMGFPGQNLPENEKTLTKKMGRLACISPKNIENEGKVPNVSNKMKPPLHFNEVLERSPINCQADGFKTRSHSLSNHPETQEPLKDANRNMETVIKNKEFCKKTLDKSKDETVANFSRFLRLDESKISNNQTHNMLVNESLSKKHSRRSSINPRAEAAPVKWTMNGNGENDENLKKNSIEFLRKIFDLKAPFAAKRKVLLKDFLHKKLGKKMTENVESFVQKQSGEFGREVMNQRILEIIGKENENYILVFNYLFNPECLYACNKKNKI